MSDSQSSNLRDRVAVLRRCRGALAMFVISAMLSSLALTYVFSARYRAVTTIMYRPNRPVQIKPESSFSTETAMGFPVPQIPFEVIGKTIERIAGSELILRWVVKDLRLDEPDDTKRTGWNYFAHKVRTGAKRFGIKVWQVFKYGRIIKAKPTSEAIINLAKNLKIQTKKDYTARLTVVDKSPYRAARIADKVGEVLVSTMRMLSAQASRELAGALYKQIDVKKSQMAQTRRSIEKLKTDNKFSSLREETALHLNTAEQVDRDLIANENQLEHEIARLKKLVTQRQGLTPMVKAAETIKDDPVYNDILEKKAEYEVQLGGLLKKLPEQHVEVRMLRSRIKTAGDLLDKLKPQRVSSVVTQLHDLYQKVYADELEARAKIAGLDAAQRSLRESLAKTRAMIEPPSVESRLRELELELAVQELEYKQLATAWEEAKIAEITSQPEIKVLYKATPQDAPFRPIKIYHVLLSGFLALLLGVGIAYMADFLKSTWGGVNADEPHREEPNHA